MLKSSEKKIGQSATLQNIFRPSGAFPSALLPAPALGGTYAVEVLADSPVGYWTLDDASGSTAGDSATSPHNGTYGASPTLGVSPLITVRNAVTFASASSQYMDVPSNAAFNANGRITIEAWVKTNQSGSGNPMIVCSDDSSATFRFFQFRLSTTGKLEVVIFDTGNGAHVYAGSVTINDNAVHHVVGVYDGSKVLAYVDGSADGAGLTASFTLQNGNDGHIVTAARFSSSTHSNFLNGTVDEVALYTSALTSTRILAHYNAR